MANAYGCDQCRTVLLVGEEDDAGWIRFSRLGVASRDDSEFRYPRHFCSPRCAGAWMLRLVEPLELTATSGAALPAPSAEPEALSAEPEAPFAAPPARVPAGHREDLPPAPKSEGAEAPRVRLRDLLEGAPSVDLEALAREQGKKRSRFGGRR